MMFYSHIDSCHTPQWLECFYVLNLAHEYLSSHVLIVAPTNICFEAYRVPEYVTRQVILEYWHETSLLWSMQYAVRPNDNVKPRQANP